MLILHIPDEDAYIIQASTTGEYSPEELDNVQRGLYCYGVGEDMYDAPMEEVRANSRFVKALPADVDPRRVSRVYVNCDTGFVE